MQSKSQNLEDAALGCLLGALVGDAAGAVLEFRETITKEGIAAVMTQAAQERCLGSKANGSLMRITPLGIWGYRFKDEELANYAMQDSRLSHPNLTCCYAVACYTIAIASLMRNLGDRQRAFNCARNWLETQRDRSLSLENSRGYEEVSNWLEAAANNLNIPYSPQIGFIKIAFIHAFRHLKLGTNYEEAIRETLSGGGDADTNACIVGGLMGAVGGSHSLPDRMKKPVLSCDTTLGKSRPDFLSTQFVPQIVTALLAPDAEKLEA